MKPDVASRLEVIANADDFVFQCYQLTESWTKHGVAGEAVEPVLRFMEAHPEIDYGVPGPLVHFVERFAGQGYEAELLASLRRRPTDHTVWMLNRLINGADEQLRRGYVLAMREARLSADEATRAQVDDYLNRIKELGWD